MAEVLGEAMTRAGLADPAVTLVPSLSADGTPVVMLTLTVGAVRRIDALLASGTPPPGWTAAAGRKRSQTRPAMAPVVQGLCFPSPPVPPSPQ
ncbi:hypothetical protein [Amycolatopsis sulphurea]|nr:hypothetical protein [Amycolatopsis sulphurea]